MSKSKQYKDQESSKQIVGEPAMEYCSSSVTEDANYLPDDVLIGAIKYNQIAREKHRMIPNQEIYSLLADRLGWK